MEAVKKSCSKLYIFYSSVVDYNKSALLFIPKTVPDALSQPSLVLDLIWTAEKGQAAISGRCYLSVALAATVPYGVSDNV